MKCQRASFHRVCFVNDKMRHKPSQTVESQKVKLSSAPRYIQDMLERSGLETSQDPPGGAGKRGWGERDVWITLLNLWPPPLEESQKWKKMDGSLGMFLFSAC